MSHREEFYCSNILPNSWRYLLLTLGKETTSYLCLGFLLELATSSSPKDIIYTFFNLKLLLKLMKP